MSGKSAKPSGADHHLANHKLLVMGLSRYPKLGAVDGAREDAAAIEALLVERGHFREPVVVRPSDQKLLRLRARVRRFLESLSDRDAAVVFFAGHGMLDDRQRLWLMPTDGEEPLHGLLVDDLVRWGSKAGLLVLILDCCHAGAAVKPTIPDRRDGSYAIIAACHGLDTARSDGGRGILTRAVTDAIEGGATRVTDVFERAADACDAAGLAAVWTVTRRHAAFHLVEPLDDPIRAWRTHMREIHANLVPFFDERAVLETRDVIELDVRPMAPLGPERGLDTGVMHMPSVMSLEALLSRPGDGERAPRWVVLGDPGAGKSTLARHLAWSLCTKDAPPDAPVPIFCSLARLISARQHPFDFAEAELEPASKCATGLAARLHALAESDDGQPIWLLLDGFDEIPREDTHRAIGALKGWHAKLPGVTIAVCSRPVGWAKGVEHIFRRAEVRPLGPQQQYRLLVKWLDEPRAQTVRQRIAESVSLSELAANPLMLTLLAMLHLEHQALPPTRTKLYGHALDLLLRRGHCVQPSTGVKAVPDARSILAELSLQLTYLGGEAWAAARLSEVMSEMRARSPGLDRSLVQVWGSSPDRFFEDIAQNSGVIAPHDGRTERWRYLHRSLRERLSAEALAVRGPKLVIEYIRDVAREDDALGQWAETLGLTVSLLESPVKAFRELAALDAKVALRMLPEIDGISAVEALALVGGVSSEDIDGLTRALRGRDGAAEALYAAITPKIDLDQLGRLVEVFDRLSHPLDWARFFTACGRWPTSGPPPMPPEMQEIPAGRFGMGDRGARQVTISRPFRMGRCPVTVAEYRRFDPTHSCAGGPQYPVTEVSWSQARLYAAWVGCALPTEAQWEYACRSGTQTTYWSGDEEADLARVGWYLGNSERKTQPVGQKAANRFSLHDMHGNIWEWCADWHASYPSGPAVDPLGPPTGEHRVLRGGSYWNHAVNCRSARRYRAWPGNRLHDVGFRLARPAPAP